MTLSKFGAALTPAAPKPRVAFGRDARAVAAVEAMFLVVARWVAFRAVLGARLARCTRFPSFGGFAICLAMVEAMFWGAVVDLAKP